MAEVQLKALPKKIRDIYEKGNAAMERGKYDFAIDMFLHALAQEPGLLKARERVRRIEIKQAQAKKTMAGLSTITGMKSVMGVKKAIKKEPTKAMQLAEDLLRLDLKNAQFVDLYIEAAEAAELPEAAAMTLSLLIPAFYAEDKKMYRRLIELYGDIGDTENALEAAQKLVNMDRSDQASLKMMKDAAAKHSMNTSGMEDYQEHGDMRQTLRHKDQAEELERENRSAATMSEEDLEKSIGKFIGLIESEPDNLNHYRALADIYSKAGEEYYEDARDVLEQAYEVSGESDPEIERGISAMNVKIYEANIAYLEAEDDAEQAEELRQELYAYKLQDAENAVARYPNDNQIKFIYGKLLFEGGDVQKAIPMFQKSRTHPKCRQESLFFLAMCFKAKGTLDLATEILEEAVEEIPGMTHTKKDMFYELGLIKEDMGDAEGANECFKAIYQVDYEYKDVAERIEGRGAA